MDGVSISMIISECLASAPESEWLFSRLSIANGPASPEIDICVQPMTPGDLRSGQGGILFSGQGYTGQEGRPNADWGVWDRASGFKIEFHVTPLHGHECTPGRASTGVIP